MSEKTCLVLHRKSADRPEVKEAVKAVTRSGIPLRVRIPWNKKEKAIVVREAIEAGAERIIAGGGDGTINAVVGHDADFSVATVLTELKDPFNEENRYLHYRQLAEFTIEADEELHCNLDGEPMRKRKLRFSILPGHLKLAMP